MAQYIDKDALVAEIKRRRKLVSDPILSGNDLMIGERNAYFNLLSFIDSLQEEPVREELGEYINELSKQFPEVSFAKLSRIAVRVAKWQKEQMMSKAIRGSVSVNVESNYHSLIYGCWDMDNALINYNEGDKVKVIVIKEE